MINVLYAEVIKLSKSRILWLIPVTAGLVALVGIVSWLNVRSMYGYSVHWQYLFPFIEDKLNSGYISISLAIITTYIYSNEFKTNTISSLFTYPARRSKIFFAKLLVLFVITLLLVAVTFVLVIGVGRVILQSSPSRLLTQMHIFHFTLSAILNFVLITPIILLSIIFKKESIPAYVVGIMYIVSNSIYELNKIYYLPWNIPKVFIQSMQKPLDPRYELADIKSFTQGMIFLGIWFLVPLIISIYYYSKMELKNVEIGRGVVHFEH